VSKPPRFMFKPQKRKKTGTKTIQASGSFARTQKVWGNCWSWTRTQEWFGKEGTRVSWGTWKKPVGDAASKDIRGGPESVEAIVSDPG